MTFEEAKEWIKSAIYDGESLRHALRAAEIINSSTPGLGIDFELERLREFAKLLEPTPIMLDSAEMWRESIELDLALSGG